jgi:hypothetical protein
MVIAADFIQPELLENPEVHIAQAEVSDGASDWLPHRR